MVYSGGSYISQAINSIKKGGGRIQLNLNKNKIVGTCREYKNLDDEWMFDCDEI